MTSLMVEDDGLKLSSRTHNDKSGLIGELEVLGVEFAWHSVQAELQDRLLLLNLKSDPQEQESVSGVIELVTVRKVELLPGKNSPTTVEERTSTAFTLFLSSRQITLKAETNQEAARWMQALKSASIPSGSCNGDQEAVEAKQTIKEVEPQQNVAVADESTVQKPVVVAEETQGGKTPNRVASQGSNGWVGSYTPKPNSRSNSERRISRGGGGLEAWRQKENMAPTHQAGMSMREALYAERLEHEGASVVQMEKRGAAMSETAGSNDGSSGQRTANESREDVGGRQAPCNQQESEADEQRRHDIDRNNMTEAQRDGDSRTTETEKASDELAEASVVLALEVEPAPLAKKRECVACCVLS